MTGRKFQSISGVLLSFSYFDTLPADAQANNLKGTPFREVSVAIDGKFVGSIMPYPLFYTGAMVPTFWKPVVGIGCFPVPSYTLQLTPFIELLNDGQPHTVSLSILNVSAFLGGWFFVRCISIWVGA